VGDEIRLVVGAGRVRSEKTTILAEDGSDVWEGRMREANEAIGQVNSSLGPTKWPCCGALFKIQDVTTGQILEVGALREDELARTYSAQ